MNELSCGNITVEEIRKSLSHSKELKEMWNEMNEGEREELAQHFIRLNGVPILEPDFLAAILPEDIIERELPEYLQRVNAFMN